MAEYVTELHNLSELCDFKDTLEDMLQYRLVWGITDPHIQHCSLAEDKLTFIKAQELAHAMELATKDIKKTQGGATPQFTLIIRCRVRGAQSKALRTVHCATGVEAST